MSNLLSRSDGEPRLQTAMLGCELRSLHRGSGRCRFIWCSWGVEKGCWCLNWTLAADIAVTTCFSVSLLLPTFRSCCAATAFPTKVRQITSDHSRSLVFELSLCRFCKMSFFAQPSFTWGETGSSWKAQFFRGRLMVQKKVIGIVPQF